jgi:hypothetical protein
MVSLFSRARAALEKTRGESLLSGSKILSASDSFLFPSAICCPRLNGAPPELWQVSKVHRSSLRLATFRWKASCVETQLCPMGEKTVLKTIKGSFTQMDRRNPVSPGEVGVSGQLLYALCWRRH